MTTAERLRGAIANSTVLTLSDLLNTADELEALTTELSAWKTSFGTQQLSHALAERDDLKAKLAQVEADCALMREAWRLARGRIHANFAHVPEVMRCCDWIEFVMQKALANSSGQRLLDELAHWRDANKGLQHEVDERIRELATVNDECNRCEAELATLRATAQRRLELLRKMNRSSRHSQPCAFCGCVEECRPDCPLAQELKEDGK